MPHLSIARPLLELNTQLVEALARLLNVVDADCDVSEPTARIGVPISVPLEVGVRFGAVVVGELEDACGCFYETGGRDQEELLVECWVNEMGKYEPSRAKREASISSLVRSRPS
jgi:hypothetical protein